MSSFRTAIAVPIAAACSVIACSWQVDTTSPIPSEFQQKPDHTAMGCELTANEATRIGEAAAEESGIEITNYKPPIVDFSDDDGEKYWSLLYEGKIPAPGNHFTVLINDESGTAEIVPGE